MSDRNAASFVALRRTQTIADWEALNYGMFIHYGMSTFTGHEFGRVPASNKDFAPTGLDADQWIRTARDAGMKYAVLTAKHHYGHALWPTKVSDFSVAHGPVKTDVVDAFVEACRRHDVKPGFYYSAGWDRHHQPGRAPEQYVEQIVIPQVEELLTEYGSITEMWFDIPWDFGVNTLKALDDLYACCKKCQPDCLVLLNQGFVDGSQVESVVLSYEGKPVTEDKHPMWPKDLNNGERTFPPESGHNPKIRFEGVEYYIPNEVCDSTGQRRWFWGAEDDVRPARQLYELYRNSVGRGSNLLLNVGPDQSGRIPQEYVDRLLEVKQMIDRPESVQDSLLPGKTASASNVFGGEVEAWGPQLAIDMDVTAESGTRWATDESEKSAWLEVDLGREETVGRVTVSEYLDAIRSFEIKTAGADGAWTPVHKGGTIGGPGIDVSFSPAKASRIRLEILEATQGPSIWDFAAYPPR